MMQADMRAKRALRSLLNARTRHLLVGQFSSLTIHLLDTPLNESSAYGE